MDRDTAVLLALGLDLPPAAALYQARGSVAAVGACEALALELPGLCREQPRSWVESLPDEEEPRRRVPEPLPATPEVEPIFEIRSE